MCWESVSIATLLGSFAGNETFVAGDSGYIYMVRTFSSSPSNIAKIDVASMTVVDSAWASATASRTQAAVDPTTGYIYYLNPTNGIRVTSHGGTDTVLGTIRDSGFHNAAGFIWFDSSGQMWTMFNYTTAGVPKGNIAPVNKSPGAWTAGVQVVTPVISNDATLAPYLRGEIMVTSDDALWMADAAGNLARFDGSSAYTTDVDGFLLSVETPDPADTTHAFARRTDIGTPGVGGTVSIASDFSEVDFGCDFPDSNSGTVRPGWDFGYTRPWFQFNENLWVLAVVATWIVGRIQTPA